MEASSHPDTPSAKTLAEASSELNNLLQIISGSSDLIEHNAPGSKKTAESEEILRYTLDRVEKLAADLARHAGGTEKKELMHPKVAGFARQTSTPSNASALSILVVDDEEMALRMIRRVLSAADFEVTTASSGFQCLDLVRSKPHVYDLVLLDLTMPFMDGEETFRRLREIRSDLPVVLCTGFIEHERLTRLMDAGMSGFLRKPIPADEIVSFVRATLANLRYGRDALDPRQATAAG